MVAKVYGMLLLLVSVVVLMGVQNVLAVQQPLLNPDSTGFGGQTRSDNYDSLLNGLYSPNTAVSFIGDKVWVPWFSTSSSCTISDLHSGTSCNSGQGIDFAHNCMVTDEFSQVAIVTAMGKNQTRMDGVYNTVQAIKSDKGQLPGWRIYRDGNTIDACRSGINGNCDTASDGDARIISSLYTSSKNSFFSDGAQKNNYQLLARNLSRDFVRYEVLYNCRPSSLGQGNICYWLASGANTKSGGFGSGDFAYTGYYGDSIIAMLQACSNTGNQTYCRIADDFTLNYLEASKYNRLSFSAPPGRSFSWINTTGIPVPQCTGSCSPVMWDYADASRAVGICQANYYASLINHTLPLLQEYCNKWSAAYMRNPSSAPIQYYPDGSALNYQSGYFAQGLESLHEAGANVSLFRPSVDSALGHYNPSTRTWDYTACFGVYMQSFAVRSLGFGIGRDLNSFNSTVGNNNGSSSNNPIIVSTSPAAVSINNSSNNTQTHLECQSNSCTVVAGAGTNQCAVAGQSCGFNISSYGYQCTYNGIPCIVLNDNTSGDCRTVVSTTYNGNIQIQACRHTNSVEIYRQSYPATGNFQACLNNVCVDELRGFNSFSI